MARISIPLEAITSRLNLGARFDSVRSQSLAGRFANLKPISEFVNLKAISRPNDFAEVQSRINYNLAYFSSNYAVVFVMLSVYALITNLLLLFVIVFVVGGMWGIGKLKGADLDIGVVRATTSQLYTGLVCISVPLAFLSGPISTMLWLIGATGGGLGGRPRTPYDVPPWGRPPGARLGRRGDARVRREQSWEYDERFEELGTDYDDIHDVDLRDRYAQQRFTSDELRFTGIDMGKARPRQRRSNRAYDEDSDYSDTDELPDPRRGGNMQLMLREKEDILVERALERIARARAMGKTNVKLSQAEIDALDRLERSQQRPPATPPLPRAAPKSKKAAQARPKAADRRQSRGGEKSGTSSPKRKAAESRARGRSTSGARADDEAALVPYPVLPDGPRGTSDPLTYPPPGFYMPAPVRPSAQSSRSGSRTASLQSLRQQNSHTPPIPASLQQYYQGRYSSNPDIHYAARPASSSSRSSMRGDPSDPDWEPRARSSSSLISYPLDQLPQSSRPPRFDPQDPRFASPQASRRVASGPVYSSQRQTYRPPDELFLPNHVTASPEQEELSSEDEDSDQGVSVEIETSDGEYRVRTQRGGGGTGRGTRNRSRGGGVAQVQTRGVRRTR